MGFLWKEMAFTKDCKRKPLVGIDRAFNCLYTINKCYTWQASVVIFPMSQLILGNYYIVGDWASE